MLAPTTLASWMEYLCDSSLLEQVSRHKRGIRNGPKALKPTPVIVRCK